MKNYNKKERNKELEYLKNAIFKGLENLNDGFDTELIYYFSESDFEIILDRVEKLEIGINGIEPWLNGDFFDVISFEDYDTIPTDSNWYRKAFSEFKKTGKKLMYAASYDIPQKLIVD